MSGTSAADGTEEGSARSGAGALVRLAAGLARREAGGLEPLLRRAAKEADPAAVEEVILQSHLFLGFPAALAGMRAWRRVDGAAEAVGPARTDRADGPEEWEERGEDVCRRVYGSAYGALRRNVRGLHPDLDEWMVRDGYGKVLGRAGLDLPTRELCIVATLAAAGTTGRPLHSHLRGALLVGAEAGRVEEALEAGLERLDRREDRRRAREVWARVRERRRGARTD